AENRIFLFYLFSFNFRSALFQRPARLLAFGLGPAQKIVVQVYRREPICLLFSLCSPRLFRRTRGGPGALYSACSCHTSSLSTRAPRAHARWCSRRTARSPRSRRKN